MFCVISPLNLVAANSIIRLPRSSVHRCVALLSILLLSCFLQTVRAQDDQTGAESALPTAEFLIELEKLATKCDELNLPEQASQTRSWWPQTRPDQTWLVFPIAEDLNASAEKNNLIDKWRARFEALRRRHALYLLEEAQKLLASKDETSAYRLVWRAYREDPQNKQLAFVLQSFLKASDIDTKARLATTPHPKYNWPAKTFHRVQLPHFRVVSNASPEILEKWTQELEKIFSVWTQAYPDLWLAPGALKNRLAGKNVPLERKAEMNVVLFRSREDYVQQLGKSEALIESSVGYYSPKDTTSFFYVEGDSISYPTLVHELTHQILQEASLLRGSEPWATDSDFWIVEAIALHAESIWLGDKIATVGGWESPRLQVARYRILRDDYWMEWESLRSHSAENWKQQPELAKAYTQSAGLAHLFLDSNDPVKRETFFKYLTSVYRNKPNSALLDEAIPASALKEKYEDMMQVPAQSLEQLSPDRKLEECVLIGCELPSTGLKFLGSQAELQWLDLSFMALKDSHCEQLADMKSLERLSLEGTTISNLALRNLVSLKQLSELDLSGTQIDDQGLQLLVQLPRLETLWLTETQVTDAAFTNLRSMKSLKFLQVDGSKITKSGWADFLQQRPDLAPQNP